MLMRSCVGARSAVVFDDRLVVCGIVDPADPSDGKKGVDVVFRDVLVDKAEPEDKSSELGTCIKFLICNL